MTPFYSKLICHPKTHQNHLGKFISFTKPKMTVCPLFQINTLFLTQVRLLWNSTGTKYPNPYAKQWISTSPTECQRRNDTSHRLVNLLKRMMNRRDWAHKKARRTGKSKDLLVYKRLCNATVMKPMIGIWVRSWEVSPPLRHPTLLLSAASSGRAHISDFYAPNLRRPPSSGKIVFALLTYGGSSRTIRKCIYKWRPRKFASNEWLTLL